jgi:hypothetical protein
MTIRKMSIIEVIINFQKQFLLEVQKVSPMQQKKNKILAMHARGLF